LSIRETTSQVHPEQFTKGIWEEAEKLGVQTVFGTVEALEKRSDGTYSLSVASRDEEGSLSTLSADQVVVCAGPWTGKLLSTLGIKGGGRARRIDGSRAHSVVLKTAPGRELPAQALFTSIKEQKGGSAEPEIYSAFSPSCSIPQFRPN
jgi:glycine/D-amino acid oxidase-like deaminating enzyme